MENNKDKDLVLVLLLVGIAGALAIHFLGKKKPVTSAASGGGGGASNDATTTSTDTANAINSTLAASLPVKPIFFGLGPNRLTIFAVWPGSNKAYPMDKPTAIANGAASDMSNVLSYTQAQLANYEIQPRLSNLATLPTQ